jgi:hypothetical protein
MEELQQQIDALRRVEERTPQQQQQLDQLLEQARQNPGQLRDVVRNIPIGIPEGQGVVPLAYTLATQTELDLPDYQVAGFTPDQQAAFQMARNQLGSFQPYLDAGYQSTMQGIGAMGGALSGTQQLGQQIPGQIAPGQEALFQAAQQVPEFAQTGIGQADLASERARASTAQAQQQLREASQFGLGAAQQGLAGLAPDVAQEFMSPYEDAAVQQALSDIARQGELQGQELRSGAVGAGAFGGSRQAVAEQELARNILEQQGRTAAQLRAAGFESAANRAQQAASLQGQLGQIGAGAAAGAAEAGGRLGLSAEQLAQTGGLQGAQLGMQGAQQAGNLGLQGSQLGLQGIQAGLGAQQQQAGIGQGIAGLGQQQLGFGQAQQQLGLQDVNTMMQVGQQQQAQQQAQLDAQRMNEYQQAMMPFQQLAFASDITTGAPTGITSVMSQPVQSPSAISQLGGLALGAGALFGQGGPFGGSA